MVNKEGVAEFKVRLTAIRNAAASFFDKAQVRQDRGEEYSILADLLTPELLREGEDLRADIKRFSVDMAGAVRGSPLISEADLHDMRHNTRRMLASIHFRNYQYQGVYVHHDEGTVLGVDPPSQQEKPLWNVSDAHRLFKEATSSIDELIDLMSPAETVPGALAGTETYRTNTAFIMMAIDRSQPELEDIKNGIKDVCKEFGITAITADDIEHDGAITDRVLQEIETNEFLIADLTGERPNVYYEVGHAHARNNITDLKQQLRRRMEAITNRPRKT